MIDAHVHIWRLGRNGCTWPPSELETIHRDFVLADVDHAISTTGVDRVVLVQSQDHEDDTPWLLAEAAASPLVAGVVGWMEPGLSDAASRIAHYRELGPLVGLRAMAQDHPAEWLDNPALHDQFADMAAVGIALDLLVRPQHLPASERLASLFPALPMVLDHCAKPHIAENGLPDWREAIAHVAERPNMMCKLSGLITEATPDQPMDVLVPYVETALDLFGAERLIWGSDWPVLNLNGTYAEWLAFARAVVPAAHHEAVFGGNARAFYRLDP